MLLKNKSFLIFIVVVILSAIIYFVADFELCPGFNLQPAPITKAGEEELDIEYDTIITSKIGENTTIVLESNPTTGYQWQVDYDSGKLELISQEFNASENLELVGAPGTEVFIFKAIELGESDITFSYLRPWETDLESEELLYFNLIVE